MSSLLERHERGALAAASRVGGPSDEPPTWVHPSLHKAYADCEKKQAWLNRSWQNPYSQNRDYLSSWQKSLNEQMRFVREESARLLE